MNDRRIDSVEKNITALNEQIALLNNRVYEVRTNRGKKTGMTVVPVIPQQAQPAQAPQPVAMHPQEHTQPIPRQSPQQVQTKKREKQNTRQKDRKRAEQPQVAAVPQTASLPPSLPPVGSTNPQMVEPAPASSPSLPPTMPLASQAPALPTEQAPSARQRPQRSPQPVARTSQAGEDASYQQALSLARKGRSSESIQKFNEYLSKYPNGKYAPNASYWIGECYYSQGKYREALGKYEEVNAKYPTHHKNADALLKSGMAYKRLGDSSNASAKYSELQQSFPSSEAARRARRER
ncbi:MAG: tol-pal system protein YbgF [Desulfovibrionaceae bacterium]|nr:tol-pal system protein YbgF [Desulfovibrionaceae bacterium]